MRLLLAAAVFLHSAQAADVGMNQPCNKELDGLLATDPSGNPNTFLSCVGVGVGNIGFWERKVCPNDMVFDFINQQCKAKRKKSRKQQTLNIAILNNSCAQGETCIGGTVCDLDTLRCLCPFGTIPQVETLSCIKNDVSPAFNFNSFNFESGFNTGDFFRPNPKAATAYPSYNSRGNQEQGYSGSSSSWQPFPGQLPSDFKPNHNQFNFNVFTTTAPAPTTQKVPILAYPGQSCRNDEVCSGGSICTLPIGLCLCPGELEARHGECVLPASAAGIQISKVGIGALCSELAECDHGSSCIMGRCACVAPLLQHEGKCVLRQESKKVGPGELCDNGEICIKGSVCDNVIPVCVCPTDTDLRDGECIRVAPKTAAPRPATYIPAMTAPPPTARPQPPPQPQPTQAPFTHPAPTYVPPTQPVQTYRPATPPPAPAPSTVNYQSFSPPPMRPTIKPNHMKINLGGSKQAGVGVRCALNTDCMIGAYCNGNTNPPSCQCLSTHVNIEGRCEKIVYPGQIGCRSDLQCSSAYTGTTCIDRVCVCPEGNKAVDQTCVPANEPVTSPPGGSCTEARECTGGSVCREGWCICPDPTMIVQKGICIQSGPRPTLPSRTVPVYTTPSPAYTPAAAPVYHTAANPAAGRTFNALPNPQQQSRKRTPGSQCGPLDTCVGGSTCVESLCVCPAGMQPSMNGRCEPAPSTSPSIVAASQYSRPGESCSLGQVCTGGSTCPMDTQLCTCPPEKPLIIKDYCHPEVPARRQAVAGESCDANTDCTNGSACHSGQCRCPPQYVAFSGHCVHMPMQTTPAMKMVAKPLESCDDGEVCTGGSSCDEDTGMCMCPAGQVAFGEQCRHPPTVAPRTTTTAPTRPPPVIITTPAPRAECSNDAHCTPGKTCIAGKCRCRPGTMDNGGICEPIEARKPLKYGQPCDHVRDRCTNGAKCLDNVCKCTPGFVLSPAGWCERFHFQLTTTMKPKTFNALPAAPEKMTESVLPARPAWNVPVEPATTRQPQTPQSINFHATLATQAPYTPPPRPPVMVTLPPTVATVPPIRETYPPPTVRTYPPPVPLAPVPTQPPVLPADNSGPRIRGRVAGTSCRDTDICLHGSSCIHGRCQCRPPLVARNGHCVKLHLAAPGEPCSKGEQCTGGSICDNDQEMCVCASRHTIVDGVCKSKDAALFVPPGSQCGGAQVCSGGSYCASGTCLCDSNHYAEDGYCRHIASQSSEIDHETGGPLRFSAMLSPRAPATVCDPEKCRLPDCFCSVTGRIPPISDPIVDVPQFVVLTFDDAVNGRTLPDYLTLFADQRYRNPNGCPVKATFFVSHEWTNYDAVQWLADQDMELASNSISHTNMAGENASRWLNEMDGQRRILAKFGNIPEEKIVGMRAPQLSAGGDAQFEMMSRAGFLYDNTLSANPGIHGEPYWPQTLDYAVPWNCYEENCPSSSFPGLWEVPLNQFYGAYVRQIDSYRRSSMIRAAVDLNNTIDELTNMLLTNFDRAYTSNKAPFVLSLNADFLQLNGRNEGMAALQKFLDEIMQHKDVFLVSLHQLIEWMQNPLPMTMIHKSDPLRCDRARFSSNPRNACTQPNKCMYRTPAMTSYEHQFKTCAPCPDVFPWIHNPTGNIR